ncbi:MAG: polyphosphate kinase 2 family protein [Propionibacteriaceae bacterium]|nr:polyphosphate kinase 2 family protein [Propionibacteriaceae bacterium]
MSNSKPENATQSLRSVLRCPRGPVDVSTFNSGATPLFSGDGKKDAAAADNAVQAVLDDLQERLFANSRVDETTTGSVLLVLQGMDTAGKGGVVTHVIGMVDPQGVSIRAFKAPTAEERAHDFLWRVRNALPTSGMIGIFDRSHYEDVLIQRVEAMAPAEEIEARYGLINEFERQVSESGTRIVKCFLNVSKSVQKKRLMARLDDPTKYWKYNPGDLAVRSKWDDYMVAYGLALTRCNQDFAPWYVIPSDHKWYRNWAIAQILMETLQDMNLTWPKPAFSVAAEKARVKAS